MEFLSTARFRSTAKVLLIAFALIWSTIGLVKIAAYPNRFQWDMRVYYQAPLLLQKGIDPYMTRNDSFSGFVYPPAHLQVFRFFTDVMTEPEFYYFFLATKVLLFVGLILMWRKSVCREIPPEIFFIFMWFGLGAPFKRDLDAGNVSIFETTLLVFAFWAFVKERLIAFALLVAAAATFKLTPIVFLTILLFPATRKGLVAFAAGCAAFAGFLAANFLAFPELSRSFVHQALVRVSDENGAISPSLLALIRDFADRLPDFAQGGAKLAAVLAYLLAVAFILFKSARVYKELLHQGNSARTRALIVLFAILVYTIAMPRMKDYAYMIALPSVVCVLTAQKKWRWLWLAIAITFPNVALTPHGLPILPYELWVYCAWVISLMAWWRFGESHHEFKFGAIA